MEGWEAAVGDQLDREHQRRLRAENVRAVLRDMWGDELPTSMDPVLDILIDAVAIDDDFGRQHHLVVQGDGLSQEQLRAALRESVGSGSVVARTVLAGLGGTSRRLVRTVHDVDAGVVVEIGEGVGEESAGVEGGAGQRSSRWGGSLLTPGMAVLPGPECGAWELDFATGRVSLEAVTARLMGVGHAAGSYPLAQFMREGRIHEADQPRVQAALEEALQSGNPYECRFRSLLADGSYAWRASRARVIPVSDVAGAAPHLVGFIAADE